MVIEIEDKTKNTTKKFTTANDLEYGTVFEGSIFDEVAQEYVHGIWLYVSNGYPLNGDSSAADAEEGFFRLDEGEDDPFSYFYFYVTDPNELIMEFKEVKATLVLENA